MKRIVELSEVGGSGILLSSNFVFVGSGSLFYPEAAHQGHDSSCVFSCEFPRLRSRALDRVRIHHTLYYLNPPIYQCAAQKQNSRPIMIPNVLHRSAFFLSLPAFQSMGLNEHPALSGNKQLCLNFTSLLPNPTGCSICNSCEKHGLSVCAESLRYIR